eukprot:TRINITY_DN1565_c0_g2_i3.p1 TRINITY_DN1565_c0_g2~~TRINITY_DN1565_c0_g2_i3.p1  ORF type:complete len:803 (-),score=194.59 TRINITY_DN1565_c0_g2_i3:63-2471(-)
MGDRFSYRYVLLYGTSAASICGVLFALSAPPYFNVIQHSAYILIFWFLYGFSQAAGLPTVNALLNKWFPSKYRGVVFGSFGVSPQIGYLICNGLAALLFSQGVYWAVLIFIIASFLFFMGLLDVFLIPTAKSVLPTNVKLVALDTELEVKSGAAFASRGDGRGTLTLWGAFKIPDIPWYACAYFFGRMTTYSVLAWMPYFLHTHLGFETASSSLLSMIYDGACIAGSFIVGLISSSIYNRRGAGRVTVFHLMFLIAPITLAVYVGVLLPGPLSQKPSPPSVGAVVGVTILVGLIIPVIDCLAIGTITADLGIQATEKRGLATVAGVVNSFGNFGAGISCALIPIISSTWGWGYVYYTLMGTSALCFLLLIPPGIRDFKKVIAGKQKTREDAVPLLGRRSDGGGDKLKVQIMIDPVPAAKSGKPDEKVKSKRGKNVVGLDDDAGWDTDNGFEKFVVRKKQAANFDSSSSSDDDQSFSDGAKPHVIEIDDEIKIVNPGALDTKVRVKPGQKISSTGRIIPVIADEPDTEPSSDEEGDLVKKRVSSPTVSDPTAFEDSYVRSKEGGMVRSGSGVNVSGDATLSAVSMAATKSTTSMLERRKTKLGLVRPAELQLADGVVGRGRSPTIVGSTSKGTLRPFTQPRPVPLSEIRKKREKQRPKRKKASKKALDLVDSEDDDLAFNSDEDSDLEWSDYTTVALLSKKPMMASNSSFVLAKPPSTSMARNPSNLNAATTTAASSSATNIPRGSSNLNPAAMKPSGSSLKNVPGASSSKSNLKKEKVPESDSEETEPSSSSSSSNSSDESD